MVVAEPPLEAFEVALGGGGRGQLGLEAPDELLLGDDLTRSTTLRHL
jgi:hypothetical protein